jgi:hypothetical protein
MTPQRRYDARMEPIRRLTLGVTALSLVGWAAWSGKSPVADEPLPVADAEVHRAPDATHTGMPKTADPKTGGTLRLTVFAAAEGGKPAPTFARVSVVGPDGNAYEPSKNPLAPWSLQRTANRTGKGPFRYYGWFFYASPGAQEIVVPPGDVQVHVWKGFEYLPVSDRVTVAAGEVADHSATLRHVAPVAGSGWHSGDTHIHFERKTETDDLRCLDLAEAEDIHFAHILCMNHPRTYQPLMEQQEHPQFRGMGPDSLRKRGDFQIASGQEYRANTYGHICLIGGNRLVDADGLKTDPNLWPAFGIVADELHGLGGYAFHAHGGYGKEIYADFARQATDGVELLQFAEYRGIGLEGWYHILNAGYRFPAVGACDYPYCRALGDCRTYCFLGDQSPTFENWNKAAVAGRSFFTTGPLLWLEARGRDQRARNSGETCALAAGEQSVQLHVSLQSPVAPAHKLQIIEGGLVRKEIDVKGEQRVKPLVWDFTLPVQKSTWIAARAYAKSPSGRDDIEAHTNPVYIALGESSPVDPTSVEWLLRKLDERIAVNESRDFPQKEKLLAYFRESRAALAQRLTKR